MGYTSAAAASYGRQASAAAAMEADPHRLTLMLLTGARQRLNEAAGHLTRGDLAAKADRVSATLSIIEGLRLSLDIERGGEIGQNLDGLYEYAMRRLTEANVSNDAAGLEEVAAIIAQIEEAWAAIRPEQPGDGDAAVSAVS